MGNSESSTYNNYKLESMEARLKQLESLDSNRDGKVTKQEMDSWAQKVESNLEAKYQATLDKKNAELAEAHSHISELEKQIYSLQSIQDQLEEKLKNRPVVETKAINHSDQSVVQLSRDRIDEWVEELLEKDYVNIRYLPDFVERQIYRNALGMGLNILDRAVNSVNIKFMGHQLAFDIEPQSENLVDKDKSLNMQQDSDSTPSSYNSSRDDDDSH